MLPTPVNRFAPYAYKLSLTGSPLDITGLRSDNIQEDDNKAPAKNIMVVANST